MNSENNAIGWAQCQRNFMQFFFFLFLFVAHYPTFVFTVDDLYQRTIQWVFRAIKIGVYFKYMCSGMQVLGTWAGSRHMCRSDCTSGMQAKRQSFEHTCKAPSSSNTVAAVCSISIFLEPVIIWKSLNRRVKINSVILVMFQSVSSAVTNNSFKWQLICVMISQKRL